MSEAFALICAITIVMINDRVNYCPNCGRKVIV